MVSTVHVFLYGISFFRVASFLVSDSHNNNIFVVVGNRNVIMSANKQVSIIKHFVFGDTMGLAKVPSVHCLSRSRLPFPSHPRIEHMCQAFKFRNKYSVIKLKLRKYTRDQAHHNFATLLQILYLYYSKVHFVDFLMLS